MSLPVDDSELKASDDRFATAFHSSPIAMAITTVAEGRYLEINEAFERQMGYKRDEICGRTSLALRVWPTPGDREAMIAALLRQKTVRDQNAQFRTKSDSLITTIYSAGLITLDGAPCVLAAIADITAQKTAERALRDSESKFRMLAETTQSGIFICRLDGAICYVNPTLERLIECSSDELRSRSMWSIIHPDSREAVQARWRGKAMPDRYQFEIVTRSGNVRWIDLSAQVIEYEGLPAIMGTGFDITDGKRQEKQLQERTALLQTLIANSPYGIMMGGEDHRIRFCNSAFQRIFQYEENEVLGKDPDALIGLSESTEAQDISCRVLKGEVVHATGLRRRKDGSKVDVEFHAVPLISGGNFVGCFGIYQDITERIRSEAKMQALRDRLTRVQDEERTRIARELHDDIGQRLALLTIQLSQLEQDARLASPELAGQLENSRRLATDLCTDAQRISHRLHPSQLSLLGLTTALSGLCDAFARRAHLRIEFVPHDDIPRLPSEVDACLYRVAQEAIQNAIKHSQCEQIDVDLAAGPDSVHLSVSDTGRGFDPSAAESNSGLGLVSMAERARSVGGQLSVQSTVNQGTRIEVSIPVRQPAADGEDSTHAGPEATGRSPGHGGR